MTRDVLRQIAVISSLGMTLTLNALANILPINGKTTGDISDEFDVLFVPAGYVFSIWSLIYLALIGFVIYQALPSQKQNPILRRIAPWFLLNMIANSAWILVWHYELFAWSLVVMLVILVTLIGIYQSLGIGRYRVNRQEQCLLRFPFSIYLAWITVATIANFTTWLTSINWNGLGFSAEVWAFVMLVIGAGLTIALTWRHRDIAWACVVIWAFVGIAVKHAAVASVSITAGALAVVILLSLFVGREATPQLA